MNYFGGLDKFFLVILAFGGILLGNLNEEERDLLNLSVISRAVGERSPMELFNSLSKDRDSRAFSLPPLSDFEEIRLKNRHRKTWESLKDRFESVSKGMKKVMENEIRRTLKEHLLFLDHLQSNFSSDELKKQKVMDRESLFKFFQKEVDETTLRRWVELELYLRQHQGGFERRSMTALQSRFSSVLRTLKKQLKFFPEHLHRDFVDDLHLYLSETFTKIKGVKELEEIQANLLAEREVLLEGLSRKAWKMFSFGKSESADVTDRFIDAFQEMGGYDNIARRGRSMILAQKLLELPPSTTQLLPDSLIKNINQTSPYFKKVARSENLKTYLAKLTSEGRSIFLTRIHDHIAFTLLESSGRLNPWSSKVGIGMFYDDNVARWPDDLTFPTGVGDSGLNLTGQTQYRGQPKNDVQWVHSGVMNMLDYFDGSFSNREYVLLGYTGTQRQLSPQKSRLPFTPSFSLHELIMEPSNKSSKSLASSTLTARASFFPKKKSWFGDRFSSVYSFTQTSLGYSVYHGDHQEDSLKKSKDNLNVSAAWYLLASGKDSERWLFSQGLEVQTSDSGSYDYQKAKTTLGYHMPLDSWDVDLQLVYFYKHFGDYVGGNDRKDNSFRWSLDGKKYLSTSTELSLGILYEDQSSNNSFAEYNRYQIRGGLQQKF